MTDNRDSLAVLPPTVDRVAAGSNWLDVVHRGWTEDINLDALTIESCGQCVLGQLFGRYGDGLVVLDLDDEDAVEFGFDRHRDEPPAVYDELTAAWLTAIRARRQAVTG